jgi:RNA polymerase sigma-70 factor, ECF subfamily
MELVLPGWRWQSGPVGLGWLRARIGPIWVAMQPPPRRSFSTSTIPADADLATLTPAEQLQFLVEQHSDAVYRVALSVTHERELAEDAAQEALLKAWQALPTFRGDSPMRNWLLRIAHNTAVSVLRARREELRSPDTLPNEASRASVATDVEHRLALAEFEEALGRLDDMSRSMIVLREIEGMSYDEIAAVLDVPLPTVKTRILRARRLLATSLKDWRP